MEVDILLRGDALAQISHLTTSLPFFPGLILKYFQASMPFFEWGMVLNLLAVKSAAILDSSSAYEAALEVGVRLIDTATSYQNEAAIGKVLKKWIDAGV